MATLAESLPQLPIEAALELGVDVLSGGQTVNFTPYIKTILPIDGYVFWLNANLLSPQLLATHGLSSADDVVVNGSLHYASVGNQAEDETIVVRRVTFTAEEEIQAFAAIAPEVLYVATWQVGDYGSFRFTFSSRGSFYFQAGQYHYVGDAIYPAFAAQMIDNLADFDTRQVVSSSMPIWLSMLSAVPYVSLVTISLPVYPAFLVPDNLVPAYAAISIPTEGTRALQALPARGPTSSRSQLCADRVRVTLYGLRNDDACDYLDYVIDYCTNTSNLGLMNTPCIQDGRRVQTELTALAQQKFIDFEVSYNQARSRDIARQTIQSIVPTFASFVPYPNGPVPPYVSPIVPPV